MQNISRTYRESVSLLDWITSQDKASTLDRIVEQCGKALESLSDSQYEAVCMEIAQTNETWAQDLMKEVLNDVVHRIVECGRHFTNVAICRYAKH